jgi:ribosomal protein S3
MFGPFGRKARKEASERLGFEVTLWMEIRAQAEVFARWVYNKIFPTKQILISMYYNMINHFASPEKAYKYMNDSGIVKVKRGWNKITVWAKRPGIFIGPAGREVYYLEEKLCKKIIVKEHRNLNAVEKAYEHMAFVCAYHDEY